MDWQRQLRRKRIKIDISVKFDANTIRNSMILQMNNIQQDVVIWEIPGMDRLARQMLERIKNIHSLKSVR